MCAKKRGDWKAVFAFQHMHLVLQLHATWAASALQLTENDGGIHQYHISLARSVGERYRSKLSHSLSSTSVEWLSFERQVGASTFFRLAPLAPSKLESANCARPDRLTHAVLELGSRIILVSIHSRLECVMAASTHRQVSSIWVSWSGLFSAMVLGSSMKLTLLQSCPRILWNASARACLSAQQRTYLRGDARHSVPARTRNYLLQVLKLNSSTWPEFLSL